LYRRKVDDATFTFFSKEKTGKNKNLGEKVKEVSGTRKKESE
jgi:hypothetical protein